VALTNRVRAGRRGLRVWTGDRTQTIDVFFDDHRVWSTKLPDPEPRTGVRKISWPAAMAPYLRGTSTLTIRDSANGELVGSAVVRFGGPGRAEITDAQGRWLAMDKWNRLGPYFDGNASGVQSRLLASSAEVAGRMAEWGYPVFIVGGTLLGSERSGMLLPHDDDVDFAFWCDKSDPHDVALVGFELQRQLEAEGYTVVPHGHTHLEIVFFTDEGSIDYYIDMFTGYHSADGLYNQPFALRGELSRDDLVPTRPVEVGGVLLPAPAVPDAWLAFAYGPDWRVPDPSFRWETPRETLRRFENSYGVFNRQRVYWEKHWQQVDKRGPAEADAFVDVDRFLKMLPEHSFVIDLGCGDGRQAERIAAAGHDVLGVDYSFEALRVARQTQPSGVDYRWLNLNDRRSLLRFALELIDEGRQPYFFAHNLLHSLTGFARADLFVMLHGVLDPQTFLYATWDVTAVDRVQSNPQTWSLGVRTVRREARRFGLGTTVVGRRQRRTPYGERGNATAIIWP
jgi:hypothetical protein